MSLKLADLKNALADKTKLTNDLASANEQITKLQADLTSVQESAALEKSRADELQTQIDEANSTISQLTGQVTTLEGEKKTVSEATVETLHQLGVPATDLPVAAQPGQSTDADIYKQWQALQGGEKTSFFRNNIAALERFAASSK